MSDEAPVRATEDAQPTLGELAGAILLATGSGLAAIVLVFGIASIVVPHTETLEAFEWLAAFAVAIPVAMLVVQRTLADSAVRSILPASVPFLVLAAGFTLWTAREADGAAGRPIPLPWSLLLVLAPVIYSAVHYRNGLPSTIERLLLARADHRAWQAAGMLVLGAVLGTSAFLVVGSWTVGSFLLSVALLACVLLGYTAIGRFMVDRRAHIAVAILVPAVLALLLWDVSFQSLPSHQDFYIGPANDVRHGRYMLVDTYSQYGVGVIYFVTGALELLSFGYGSLVLLIGVLTAIGTIVIYVVLRTATGSVALAGAGTLVASLAGPIGTLGRVTQFPSVGFLRFGVPWLLVTALVLAYSRERPRRTALVAAYLMLAISSIWSFETAFYSICTFVAVVAVVAWTAGDDRRTRVRTAAGHLLAGIGSIIFAMVVLALSTWIGRGELPRPGAYVDFVRLYSSGGFGTVAVPDWSIGYLMCGAYVMSFVAVAVVVSRAPHSELARRSRVVPIVATTAFGASSFTYFLGRSAQNNLTHIAPPFVAMLTLWTAVLGRSWARDHQLQSGAAVLLALWGGAFLTTQKWNALEDKGSDSALVALVGPLHGKPGLLSRVSDLRDEPLIDPDTTIVEQLVRETVPPNAPLLVAVDPEISTEVLIRLDRSDVLPIAAPVQDGLVPRRRDAIVDEAAHVPCDTRLVTQATPMPPGQGQDLLDRVVAVVEKHYILQTVATVSGYSVSIIRCKR